MEGCILWEWRIITNMITRVFLNWTRRFGSIRRYTVRKHTHRQNNFISPRNGRALKESSSIRTGGTKITKQSLVLKNMMSGKARRKENVGWMIPRPLSFALKRNSPTDLMTYSTIRYFKKQCSRLLRNSTVRCTAHSKVILTHLRSLSEWALLSELYKGCYIELW